MVGSTLSSEAKKKDEALRVVECLAGSRNDLPHWCHGFAQPLESENRWPQIEQAASQATGDATLTPK